MLVFTAFSAATIVGGAYVLSNNVGGTVMENLPDVAKAYAKGVIKGAVIGLPIAIVAKKVAK